jgi:hypothetical protein
MGGTVDFESIEGEGSFFYIDVPILDTNLCLKSKPNRILSPLL